MIAALNENVLGPFERTTEGDAVEEKLIGCHPGEFKLSRALDAQSQQALAEVRVAVHHILKVAMANIPETIQLFTPISAGGSDGASWKQGLGRDVTFDQALEHANRVGFMQPDFQSSMHTIWSNLSKLVEIAEKPLTKFIDVVTSDEMKQHVATMKQAKSLLKTGRVTMAEGIMLTDGLTKEIVSRQQGSVKRQSTLGNLIADNKVRD